MRLEIIVNSENSALTEIGWGAEVERILRQIISRLFRADGTWTTILDVNGNDVGRWRMAAPRLLKEKGA